MMKFIGAITVTLLIWSLYSLTHTLGLENTLWIMAAAVIGVIGIMMSILTYPKEGEIIAIDFGNSLHNLLMKIPKAKWTSEGQIEATSFVANPTLTDIVWKPTIKWAWLAELTWKYFRAYPVGIPGFFRVHTMNILKKRLRDKPTPDTTKSLVERWIEEDEEQTTINSLRQRFPRPVYAAGVELPQDGALITFVGRAMYEVTRPEIAIYRIGGNFMSLIEIAVSQGIVSACKMKYENPKSKKQGNNKKEQLSYNILLSLDVGIKSEFVKNVLAAVNDGSPAVPGGAAAVPGLEEQCGIRVTDLYIAEWDADADTKELVKAQQAYEISVGQGRKTVQDAENAARAKRIGADAESERLAKEGAGRAAALKAELFELKEAGLTSNGLALVKSRQATPGLTSVIEQGAVSIDSTVNLTGGTTPPAASNQQP